MLHPPTGSRLNPVAKKSHVEFQLTTRFIVGTAAFYIWLTHVYLQEFAYIYTPYHYNKVFLNNMFHYTQSVLIQVHCILVIV